MNKKSLVAKIFIIVCGVLAILALIVPFLSYSLSAEFIANKDKMTYSSIFGLFDSDYVTTLSNHFRNFTERDWLLIVSDASIILAIASIIVTVALAVIEILEFVKIKLPAKLKKIIGLVVLICGIAFIASSLIFFIFSSNVSKDGAGYKGYTISAFYGHVGWYFVAVSSCVAGLIAFKRKIKKPVQDDAE